VFCGRCGSAVPEQSRFCSTCGAPTLVPDVAERRKLVTVLFADIAGSTAIGERLDPEAVRTLLARHFSAIRAVIERHGGTVEKFIGDAVMAVFGIPQAHEDDALRAVRAATELQGVVASLNAETDAVASVAIRIGVNSGEVVSADGHAGETLVTGDTVNTAARLEQAAAPGEILLGPTTYRLVEDAVTVEPVEPLSVKGKAAPVSAVRLLSVVGTEGRRRHLETTLVGRTEELHTLHQVWEQVGTGDARVVTVVAPAGVGKSRLVNELISDLAPTARVLTGRCLPYGEGITYWPIRSIFLAAAGVTEGDDSEIARAKLAEALSASARHPIVEALSAAIGLGDGAAAQDEIFWATRRAFETLAGDGPLLVVIDDLHWAEPTMLDLLQYLAELLAAPILILATARPELLESRPDWTAMGERATLLRLEALDATDTDLLLDAQAGGAALPGAMRRRILDAAEGNPLFIEEMVGMLRDQRALVEDGNAWQVVPGMLVQVEVPTSIRALLSARLDRLPAEERVVTERAAVVGRSFEAAALVELAPEGLRGELGRRLLALVRKELLRPDRSDLSHGDAFRFRHVLIRDAAYEMLPKSERAILHERFAHWLERVAGDRLTEFQEILGYHFEQSSLYRAELGQADEAERLGRSAGAQLFAAGERASRRGDNAAAIPLLRKAAGLLAGADRTEARFELAIALTGAGQHTEAMAIDRSIRESAAAEGDAILELRVQIRELVSSLGSPDYPYSRVRSELRDAVRRLEGSGLDRDLAWAWLGIGMVSASDSDAERDAFERAIDHAERGGSPRVTSAAVANLATALLHNAVPIDEALRQLADLSERGVGGRRAQAALLGHRAAFLGMLGQFDDARRLSDEALELCRQMRLANWQLLLLGERVAIELLAGMPAAAETVHREADALIDDMEPMRPWYLADRAMVHAANGRVADALELADTVIADEEEPEVVPKGLRARSQALLARGDHAAALEAIDQAVRILGEANFVADLATVHFDRAQIRRLAGQAGWREDLEIARAGFSRKGHNVGLGWVETAAALPD
jgi:class 3 adenylate cyclase/tetratricopeptide (TPR) repeat protein